MTDRALIFINLDMLLRFIIRNFLLLKVHEEFIIYLQGETKASCYVIVHEKNCLMLHNFITLLIIITKIYYNRISIEYSASGIYRDTNNMLFSVYK